MSRLVGTIVITALAAAACQPDRADLAAAMRDGGGTTAGEGVPCDVARAFASCLACHGGPPLPGVPLSLRTYEELAAPRGTGTAASLSAARMRDPIRPMPPSGGAPEADIAAIEAWVAAGLPRATCGEVIDTPPPLPDSPPGCQSNRYWQRGNDGSSLMHPGLACVACHLQSGEDEAPVGIGGTVFPGTHEFDDCYGVSGATVELIDATGRKLVLPTNAAGNFSSSAQLAMPYTARVLVGDRVRAMATAQSSGDCNACHTETGDEDAPGRIVAP